MWYRQFLTIAAIMISCCILVGCQHEYHKDRKFSKDYAPSAYLIDSIHLVVNLKDTKTTVTSIMHIRENPQTSQHNHTLVLDGENQQLQLIRLNSQLLNKNQYQLDDQHLTIKNVPKKFTLQIVSTNNPSNNTELLGLYKSQDIFLAMCESEGFRRITYFLDRPDILTRYTTTIIADKKYPVLLSNGNLIAAGDLTDNLHYATWEDPVKKPCYIFTVIAGDLAHINDSFITQNGRKITLIAYATKDEIEQCHFALDALKKAMDWDEKTFGRVFEFDNYGIVAVHDFTAGAIETKGLNIFNTEGILADPAASTDNDYQEVTSTIGHEYFHNWTGDRITCRDWFNLTLKEGLTTFREQWFAGDVTSPMIARINSVNIIKARQFPEDAGPLAHPIKPDSYIMPNNIYTTTIYKKGAEVFRMLRTILGPELFRKGMDLYFKKFDGMAATCDDFLQTMQDVSKIDLTQFKLWFSQSGTPRLIINSKYDAASKRYYVTVEQIIAKTKKQPNPKPMMIPLRIGLLTQDGKAIQLIPVKPLIQPNLLLITSDKQTFVFENVPESPTLSLLRNFSAPVKISYDYTGQELANLIVNDTDDFARWNALQIFTDKIMKNLIQAQENHAQLTVPDAYVNALSSLFKANIDKNLLALMLQLPSEVMIVNAMDKTNPDAIHEAREFLQKTIAQKLNNELLQAYQENLSDKSYIYDNQKVAKRALKNIALQDLLSLNSKELRQAAVNQFEQSNNMTDTMGALIALNKIDCKERNLALQKFYDTWQDNKLVLNKWFFLQAVAPFSGTVATIKKILTNPRFDIENPNNVRALLRNFARLNPYIFNRNDGAGYKLITEQIIRLNSINPEVAADLTESFSLWRKLDKNRQNLIRSNLQQILSIPDLSKNVYEVAYKILTE